MLVSCDSICISASYSPTLQIFDIDDEIAQPDSDRDSFDHDSDPIDERVSPAIGDVETVDFGTEDQPKDLNIGSSLSIDERDRLIHLLKSYLGLALLRSLKSTQTLTLPSFLGTGITLANHFGYSIIDINPTPSCF